MAAKVVNNNQLSKPAFNQEFAEDVMVGLSAKSKYLKPKYFYDHTGSELFEEICLHPFIVCLSSWPKVYHVTIPADIAMPMPKPI